MGKVVLFIAMSLDGFIADAAGGVAWLGGQDAEAEMLDTYAAFIKDVDRVVMGRKTWQQIATELSPTEWVYKDLHSYVITHRELSPKENIQFAHASPVDVVRQLKEQAGKNIWICGGADIAQQLMQRGLIDRYYISIMPTILGKGIRLFGTLHEEQKLRLIETKSYNGIVEVIYEKR